MSLTTEQLKQNPELNAHLLPTRESFGFTDQCACDFHNLGVVQAKKGGKREVPFLYENFMNRLRKYVGDGCLCDGDVLYTHEAFKFYVIGMQNVNGEHHGAGDKQFVEDNAKIFYGAGMSKAHGSCGGRLNIGTISQLFISTVYDANLNLSYKVVVVMFDEIKKGRLDAIEKYNLYQLA